MSRARCSTPTTLTLTLPLPLPLFLPLPLPLPLTLPVTLTLTLTLTRGALRLLRDLRGVGGGILDAERPRRAGHDAHRGPARLDGRRHALS